MAGAGEDAASLKDQANAAFKEHQYLKAAALYTKAIKLDPQNAVLFSNRSTALLKLKKVNKALEDADEVIKLRPDWDKGYFRKAAVCEEQGQLEQALQQYEECLAKSSEGANREVAAKVRALQKKLGLPVKAATSATTGTTTSATTGATAATAAGKAEPSTAQADTSQAAGAAGAGPAAAAAMQAEPSQPRQASQDDLAKDLGSPEVAAFLQEHLEILAADLQEGSDGATQAPTVHFIPGSPEEPFEEHETHIRGAAAFDSPETLAGFVDFVRSVGQRLDATAVLSITPKSLVAFPKTWSKPGWPCGPGDGALVQLEVRQPVRLKRLFFFDFGKASATQGQLHGLDPDRFALLPTLLR